MRVRVPIKDKDGMHVPGGYRMVDVLPQTPCVHLGGAAGRTRCLPCEAKKAEAGIANPRVELKLSACAVHGQCWPHEKDPGPGVKWCKTCGDYRAPQVVLPAITTRNLLYHVCPFSGNGIWQRNVGMLLKRIKLFNGRRVVAVATGIGLDPPEHVEDLFDGRVHEFIRFENDATKRETKPFLELFGRARTDDPAQATFYGHAKGVTRPGNWQVERWTDMLYESCLDDWNRVAGVLATRLAAGSFKKVGPCFEGSKSQWHYSGSFYWFRNREAFARDWRTVDPVWWGIETWPSLVFSNAEAGVLFKQGQLESINLYNREQVEGFLQEFERWKKG